MLDRRAGAQIAANELVQCNELAKAITSLRDQPSVVSNEEMGVRQLGERIKAATEHADFDGAALEGIFPQAARRVGNTPYLSKPTSLSLRGVSLAQLAAFLLHVSDGSGLTVRDIRLRAPRSEATTHLWDAELTLSYLIYSPPPTARRES